MMKDLKTAFKLLKYSYNLKTNLVLTVIYLVYSVISMYVMDGISSKTLGCMLLGLGPMTMVQVLCMLNYSTLIRSSAAAKKMMILYPAMLVEIGEFVNWIVCTALLITLYRIERITVRELVLLLLIAGTMNVLISIYMAIVFKSYFVSIIVMSVVVLGLAMGMGLLMENTGFSLEIIGLNPYAAGAIGLVLTLLSGPLYYVVAKAFYRKPLSRFGMGAKLRNEML